MKAIRWPTGGRRGGTGEDGQTLLEFAILSPVFFLLFFGIFEAGMLFNAWVSVQHSAELGARYGVTGRDQCIDAAGKSFSGREGCIQREALKGLSTVSGGNLAVVTVKSWAYPDFTGISTSPGNACDLLEVQVRYSYQARIPLIRVLTHLDSIPLTASQRFVNEPWNQCGRAS